MVDQIGEREAGAAVPAHRPEAAAQAQGVDQEADDRVAAQPRGGGLEPGAQPRQGGAQGAMHRLDELGEDAGGQVRLGELASEELHQQPPPALVHERLEERGGEGAQQELERRPLAGVAQRRIDRRQALLAHRRQPAPKHLLVEPLLAAVVVADRGEIAAGGGGDVAHRGAEAALREQALRGVEQALTGRRGGLGLAGIRRDAGALESGHGRGVNRLKQPIETPFLCGRVRRSSRRGSEG